MIANRNQQSGFTLLEVTIAAFIILLLALGVVLVLDPFALLDRTRDVRRISDLEAVADAIDLLKDTSGSAIELGGIDLDGSNSGTCRGEATPTVYVSVPDGDGMGGCTSAPDNLPAGWSYACADPGSEARADGTGWIPLDFAATLSKLPLDPVNTWTSGRYFAYTCSADGFELSATMTTDRFGIGGSDDALTTDNGDDPFAFEIGSDTTADPRAPIAYWGFDSATSGSISDGTTAGFEESNGADPDNGTVDNADNMNMAWDIGLRGGAVHFDGNDDFVTIADSNELNDPEWTISAWYSIDALTGFGAQNLIVKNVDGNNFDYWLDFNQPEQSIRCGYMNAMVAVVAEDTSQSESLGDWHYAACTYDSATNDLTVYSDGVLLEAQNGGMEVPANSSGSLHLGRRDDSMMNSDPLDGLLDEVAIYNRVLLQEEITYQWEQLQP